MKRVTNYVFVRHRHNWLQLIRFGLVGGSGFLVNLLVAVLCNKNLRALVPGGHELTVDQFAHSVAYDLPFTDFNVRWYHVVYLISFLVAVVWNYQLNRVWTFKTHKHSNWWREFGPFFAIGAISAAAGFGIVSLLMHQSSPIALSPRVFDGSTGLRTMSYWAQLLSVALTMPVNFVVNKLWTFRAVRSHKLHPEHELPMVASAVAPEVVGEDGEPIDEATEQSLAAQSTGAAHSAGATLGQEQTTSKKSGPTDPRS